MARNGQISQLESEWENSPRWKGISRDYSAEDVVKLRGTVQVEHTLARLGARKTLAPGEPGATHCVRSAH